MNNLLPKLTKAFPFLNQRSATEDDFYDFCIDRRIEVVFDRCISTGVYVYVKEFDKHFIFLNTMIRGWFLRYVMFHEIGHFLFHFPNANTSGVEFFGLHNKKKAHDEAETVAALLLLPPCEIHLALQDKEFAENEQLQELMAFRLKLASGNK